jgi:hypothetical protein
MEDEREISALSIFFGFLLGLVMGLGILLFDVMIDGMGRPTLWRIVPIANLVVLVVAGTLTLRQFQTSGIARGITIALAVIFLLNGVCGVVVWHG